MKTAPLMNGLPIEPSLHRGLEPELQIARDLLERVPRDGEIFEKHPVLGMIEIQERFRGKHAREMSKVADGESRTDFISGFALARRTRIFHAARR